MEPDIKKNLSDLSKIPQKEFEKHFSDWMARDDVARSLQAKLRSDLIKNFNKTHLGKQILSQTTNTTGIYGAPTQRLTLSPLVLALNTLVAEFLYAQNCHFSLSVFCTEIPFRNTLPDFESTRCFRFTEPEVVDIFEAISGDANVRKDLRNRISKDYAGNPTLSLLLLILKNLLVLQKQPTVTQGTATDAAEAPHKPLPSEPVGEADAESHQTRHDAKAEIYNTNFRYLNKYLIVLSKKVKEMTQKIENLQHRHAEQDPIYAGTRPSGLVLPRPRSRKSIRRRKYENLNRSLERITENLKHMSLSKRKSKRVTAIVTAIDAMSRQFEKCAANFEQVSKNLFKKTETKAANNAQPTTTTVPEKTYANWVHEMRNTRNGEKFLNRIEISLNKALRKQKQQLQNESELKLRHQKELLKIRYKQKLMNHLNKFAAREPFGEAYLEKQNESIEKQLKLFETKHYELLNKIREAEQNAMHGAASNIATEPDKISKDQVKETKLPVIVDGDQQLKNDLPAHSNPNSDHNANSNEMQNQRRRHLAFEDAVKMQKKWQEMFKRTTIEDQQVEHIVCDAKMRIRELENESNQLEQSFRNYLERQRLLKEASREAAEKMWNNYTQEKSKIEQKYHLVKENIRRHEKRKRRRRRSLENSDTENESDENSEQRHNRLISGLNVERCRVEVGKNNADVTHTTLASGAIVYRNAILEARNKLFDNESKLKSFQLPNTQDSQEFGLHAKYLGHQILVDTPNEATYVVNKMANMVLNSTYSEINMQDQTLEQDFEISSNSSESLSGRVKQDEVALRQERSGKYKHSQHYAEIEEQQQLIANSYQEATQAFKLFDERVKKPHRRGIQAKPNENKENLQHQQKQAKPATTIEAACQLEGVPIDTTTTTTTTIKSKALPTSLVLQQSMAKMNKLFGEEQRELQAARRANKKAALTTTTLIQHHQHQQQQQQSNLLAKDMPAIAIDDVAAARTSATRQSIDTNAMKKTSNKNFNEIEKNNSTETIIESMATLKRATTEQLLATKSKQEMHNINNGNEAQVFNVDNARADGNNEQQQQQLKQQQQQMSQHTTTVGQLGVTSSTSSDTSSRYTAQPSEKKVWVMGQQVNDQQLEVGEIIDASSAAAAVAVTAAATQRIDDTFDVASSSTATSFDLQLSTGGGCRDDDAAKSSASEFWE